MAKLSDLNDTETNSYVSDYGLSLHETFVLSAPLVATTHKVTRNFFCTECDSVWPGNSALVQHMRTHSGEKPFKCDLCDKAFAQAVNLSVHQDSFHFQTKYPCLICASELSSSTNLMHHMNKSHSQFNVHCDECDVWMRGDINRHRRSKKHINFVNGAGVRTDSQAFKKGKAPSASEIGVRTDSQVFKKGKAPSATSAITPATVFTSSNAPSATSTITPATVFTSSDTLPFGLSTTSDQFVPSKAVGPVTGPATVGPFTPPIVPPTSTEPVALCTSPSNNTKLMSVADILLRAELHTETNTVTLTDLTRRLV
jgi:RNase P subunit RPR2